MKRLLILLAVVGLLAACHRGEKQSAGAPATETSTYQGGGSSATMTNTNSIIIPQNPNY